MTKLKNKQMDKLNILVVDDEPGIRSGVKRILRSYTVGYPFLDEDFEFEVLESETGEDAIEKIKNQEIDIVLLDNQLPGINGIDVLEHIKKQQIDVEVMMITSYASLELAVKATDFGAYNFVPKPFTPQELKAAIESIAKHLFLKRMTRELSSDEKSVKFQFLSVLSHELKSPINAIEGYLKIMKDRQVGDDMHAYENMVDRSIERLKGMRTLIMDLLDLTKIESGSKSRSHSKVDLNEIVRLSIDTMEPLAKQKNVKILFEPETDYFITAGRQDIQIILNNLVSNAVKYNKDEGEVRINVSNGNAKVKIEVADTGIGMDEDELKELFKEFVRIKNSKTKHITGSGLGLSIMKKLVDLYDGKVDVTSQPDVGTSFVVELPL
jgi:two-component system sensor histidine kinase/response regulator